MCTWFPVKDWCSTRGEFSRIAPRISGTGSRATLDPDQDKMATEDPSVHYLYHLSVGVMGKLVATKAEGMKG